MNENIDLTNILKDCPEGTVFWRDNYGDVKFRQINSSLEEPIVTRRTDGYTASYTKEGWHSICFPANCLLWPSRDCRDWTKFTAPWLKKKKFDPRTLKPFDKVLVRDTADDKWICEHFSYMIHDNNEWACMATIKYFCCIPYNDETKHLIGTKDEAPEFYKYWED